jgi:glutathione S-transferase
MNTMPTDSLTLYSDSRLFSPYVMSVYVSLVEKGLSFDLKKINLAKQEHYQRDYADISLSKRVPTLIHDGFSLSESSAISEYLEDTFSPPQYAPIYPAERQAKAQARELQAWLRSDFMPIRSERPTDVIFSGPSSEPLSQEAQACAAQLFEAADRLLDSGSSHLWGEWCIADTDLALMLNRLVCNGDAVPEKLSAYTQMQWQRASVQSWVQQAKS